MWEGLEGVAILQQRRNVMKLWLKMRKAINEATRLGFPHAASCGCPAQKVIVPLPVCIRARFKFLPYFGSIPAGDPAVVDNHPDMVDVNALEIEGCSYKIYGVRNEREVRMKPSFRYFLAKADGE